MLLIWLISFFIAFLAWRKDPEALRFSLAPYVKFLTYFGAITLLRVFALYITDFKDENSFLFQIPLFSLFMVWWEDVIFVMPALLMTRAKNSKWAIYAVIIMSSIIFAMGHLYQSEIWAFITLFYVPLMLHYSKKHGLSTVAACHITYDVGTYLTFLAWILFT